MPVVGKITAKFEADTKALDASLAGIEGAVNGTTAVVTAGFSKMEGQLAQTQKSVGQIALGGQLQAGAAVFGQLAGAGTGMSACISAPGADDAFNQLLPARFVERAAGGVHLAGGAGQRPVHQVQAVRIIAHVDLSTPGGCRCSGGVGSMMHQCITTRNT